MFLRFVPVTTLENPVGTSLVFHLTVQLSRLQSQTRRLIQMISLNNYLQEKEKENSDETA